MSAPTAEFGTTLRSALDTSCVLRASCALGLHSRVSLVKDTLFHCQWDHYHQGGDVVTLTLKGIRKDWTMETPLSREEAAIRVEQRLAQLRALGLTGKVRNPADRKPLSGEAKIAAQIQGHQGIIADVTRSEAEVASAVAAVQRLKALLAATVEVQQTTEVAS